MKFINSISHVKYYWYDILVRKQIDVSILLNISGKFKSCLFGIQLIYVMKRPNIVSLFWRNAFMGIGNRYSLRFLLTLTGRKNNRLFIKVLKVDKLKFMVSLHNCVNNLQRYHLKYVTYKSWKLYNMIITKKVFIIVFFIHMITF